MDPPPPVPPAVQLLPQAPKPAEARGTTSENEAKHTSWRAIMFCSTASLHGRATAQD